MPRYHYQNSAYGEPWATSQTDDSFAMLKDRVSSHLWLMTLPEKHHRIIDTQDGGKVLWYERSAIARPRTRLKLEGIVGDSIRPTMTSKELMNLLRDTDD